MKLTIVVTSTRPGRVGKTVADWFHRHAQAHPAGFEGIALADLADINLPLLDEPHHPALQKYQHAHTKRWSEIVSGSDAFVFVLPEYNHTAPPSFTNAVDYLYQEWRYKPAGFVSYGGISGGLRATETAKLILNAVEMVPDKQQVVIPMVASHLVDGTFTPNEVHEKSASDLMGAMAKWAGALKGMR